MSNLTEQPQNILVLALSGIGNLLMQLPTIEAIKQLYPESRLTVWVAPRGTKAIAQTCSAIDQIIVAKIKRSLLSHLLQSWRLWRVHYDTTFMLYPGQHLKGALYMLTTGANRRIAHAYPHLGNPKSSFLLTNAISLNADFHDIEQNLCLLKVLGPINSQPLPSLPASYHLSIPTHNLQLATKLLARLKISPDKILIGLHPGSAPHFSWKRWPLENYAALANHLITKHNAHILIFGGPDEKKLKQQLSSHLITHNSLPKSTHSIISTDLITSAAVIRHCSFFVSNDSGLMHLAAATDTKTFGLFGPTNEQRTAPRGSQSCVIRAPGTKPVFDVNDNYDLGPEPHPSILAITPEQVIQTLEQHLTQKVRS